jgi:hypothetical protein
MLLNSYTMPHREWAADELPLPQLAQQAEMLSAGRPFTSPCFGEKDKAASFVKRALIAMLA